MPNVEMDSESGMAIPTFGHTLLVFGRAILLRCPNCGGGPVLQHWMKLRVKCGTCGLRLERGESDTVMGPVFILFTLIALFSYAVLVVTLLATRTTPWDLLQNGLPLLVLVELFAFFPFAHLLWLALDLALRPVTPAELEWHRSATREFEAERDAPGRERPHTVPDADTRRAQGERSAVREDRSPVEESAGVGARP
jgi:uncharacterized protein (DUF983 family)